jgi:pyruvate formate lyase activating enzyme
MTATRAQEASVQDTARETAQDLPEVRGSTFNIQRFCTHDGPGIRTTVFVKGCPLACCWCHNPEGLERGREMAYDPARCIGCRACLEACEHGAHQMLDSGAHAYDPSNCVRCGKCVETCYAGAMEAVGDEQSAQEVVDVVLRDKPFYDNSAGGLTVSGGEPLYQVEFTAAILQLCRQAEVSTALETSCLCPWATVERFLPLVDYWMCDIKHIDAQRHRELTGADNTLILNNLRQLCASGARVLLRLPLIPGLNDQEEALLQLGAFVAELAPSEGLEVMPYHRIGTGKYGRMDKEYSLTDLPEASDDDVRRGAAVLRQAGVSQLTCQRVPDL